MGFHFPDNEWVMCIVASHHLGQWSSGRRERRLFSFAGPGGDWCSNCYFLVIRLVAWWFVVMWCVQKMWFVYMKFLFPVQWYDWSSNIVSHETLRWGIGSLPTFHPIPFKSILGIRLISIDQNNVPNLGRLHHEWWLIQFGAPWH